MRSTSKARTTRSKSALPQSVAGSAAVGRSPAVKWSLAEIAFWPLVLLMMCLWIAYRLMFRFPVWFDETVGKAVFFGLPVLLFTMATKFRTLRDSFAVDRLQIGLVLGVLVGGIFGFAGSLTSLAVRGAVPEAAPLFMADAFWWEFFLALMTGFWESLFFYGFVMTLIQQKYRNEGTVIQLLLTLGVFLAFHLPNAFLRFSLGLVPGQIVLLTFFALGQALLFFRTRNIYALTISQAIWGMVLLVHAR